MLVSQADGAVFATRGQFYDGIITFMVHCVCCCSKADARTPALFASLRLLHSVILRSCKYPTLCLCSLLQGRRPLITALQTQLIKYWRSLLKIHWIRHIRKHYYITVDYRTLGLSVIRKHCWTIQVFNVLIVGFLLSFVTMHRHLKYSDFTECWLNVGDSRFKSRLNMV